LIETSKGFIFGGYTPLPWESTTKYHPDDSQQSFIFTLKNARNTRPKKFPLKSDYKQYAISSHPECGPIFGGGDDFCIGRGDQTLPTYTNFGHSYNNDTGYDGPTFLAGERNFTVKEVEVFSVKR
jgi:hypothetical protein